MIRINRRMDIDNNIIFYLLLMLACMNFMHSGSLIMVALSLYMVIFSRGVFRVSRRCLLYALLAGGILLYGLFNSSYSECLKAIPYMLCFWIGYDGYHRSKEKQKYIYRTVLAAFLGFFLYILFLRIYNTTYSSYYRTLMDIWTGSYISVTLTGMISSVVIAFFCYHMFFGQDRKAKVWVSLALFITLNLNFYTATRTPFVLFAVVFLFSVYMRMRSTARMQKKISFLLIGLVLIAGFVLVYVTDLAGIRTALEGSFLWRRFFMGTDSDSRITIMFSHLKYTLQYPWGGKEISAMVGKHGHNALQDFYDSYGCIAGIAYLLITLSQARTLRRYMKGADEPQDYLLLIVLFAMFIQSWTEPIVSGYPVFIWAISIIHGIADANLLQTTDEEVLQYEDSTDQYV